MAAPPVSVDRQFGWVRLQGRDLSPDQDHRFFRHLQKQVVTLGDRSMLPVRAPWTGVEIGHVPHCTSEDVQAAVERGRKAQEGWARLPFRERARVMLRFHDLILDRREVLLDVMQVETGKARRHALEEVLDAAIVARYYAHHGFDHIRPWRRRGALSVLTQTVEYHHPRGVVGIIAPWNYPLTLAISDAIPALLAGNAVVLKPDLQTPFTALLGVELLREAGLPADLFLVVTGPGPETGPQLIDRSDFVTFTGSTATGRVVARQAAGRLIGCSLELGGKNALVVLDDASLGRAVEGAVHASFSNTGQLCISAERLYVHGSIYDAFVRRFVARTSEMRLGPGFGPDVDMGSLTSERQLRTVQAHVADAVAKGATVLTGGQHRPDLGPLFFEPTILAGVTPEMTLHAEETFGPVVSLYRFESDEEVLREVNASRYGLNASIWSRNTARGRALARQVEAGTVNVNEGYFAAWGSFDAPMGGFKESGLGRRHGAEGILKYTEAQTVAVQHLLPLTPVKGVPVNLYARVLAGYLRLLRRIPGLR